MKAAIWICRTGSLFTAAILLAYAVRHVFLAAHRLWCFRACGLRPFETFVTPRISVLIPMHNEERVAADILQALCECDYDRSRIEILPIDDRSTDSTGKIIDDFARSASYVQPLHRIEGNGGKPGALAYATEIATGDVLVLFDADYVPGRAILHMLVAPFADLRVGAVMGRVVPHNSGGSLLAALLAVERAAGYQVGQQARYQAGLVPQFGGTVAAVRVSALRAVGGWRENSLTEDTDLTCRLAIEGWKIAYVNHAECYEEVPQSWPVRKRQLERWVIGHTECMHQYWRSVWKSSHLSAAEKLDLTFMLGAYVTAPVLVLGWLCSVALFVIDPSESALWWLGLLLGWQMFGSQATFFEMGAAAFLDGNPNQARLIPLSLLNFFASTGAICQALAKFYVRKITHRESGPWQKTTRTRVDGNGELHTKLKGARAFTARNLQDPGAA